MSDLRALAAALQPAAPCSPADRRGFLIAAAIAHTRQLRAQERNRTAGAQVKPGTFRINPRVHARAHARTQRKWACRRASARLVHR